eukprot:s1247_g23.t1
MGYVDENQDYEPVGEVERCEDEQKALEKKAVQRIRKGNVQALYRAFETILVQSVLEHGVAETTGLGSCGTDESHEHNHGIWTLIIIISFVLKFIILLATMLRWAYKRLRNAQDDLEGRLTRIEADIQVLQTESAERGTRLDGSVNALLQNTAALVVNIRGVRADTQRLVEQQPLAQRAQREEVIVMAQDLRAGRKKAMVLEDAELRSLRIPSTAHRGSLSPSKHSYLPTLQEQAREDRPQTITSRKTATEALVEAEKKGGGHASPETHVLTDLSADVLENVKAEFVENGGALNGEQFVRAMLRNLDGDRSGKSQVSATQESASPIRSASIRAAAVMDLFSHVDVHGESSVTWEDVSNYFIEQGMSGGDEFTVDSIKTYEVSQVKDVSKHETPVEKLVYLEQIDSLVCLSRGSRNFRLYDPKRCILKDTVPGHRGTVINCCYVDAWTQIATTAADMTICFWDSHLQLRNRLAAKDVQLCLQWDSVSRSLFSGAIDGTLSRWDLNNMTLADLRKGNHKKAINDLLMVHDINLLASASSDGSILMWDTTMMKPKKTFKGHKKGTFSLAYSMDYHCLLTAGLDQEALGQKSSDPTFFWLKSSDNLSISPEAFCCRQPKSGCF